MQEGERKVACIFIVLKICLALIVVILLGGVLSMLWKRPVRPLAGVVIGE